MSYKARSRWFSIRTREKSGWFKTMLHNIFLRLVVITVEARRIFIEED